MPRWARLQIEADDMPMTAAEIERHWPLSGVVTEPLQAFDNRDTLGVVAHEGQFVCKSTSGQFTDQEFGVRTAIFRFLEDRRYAHAPKLIKTKSGADFVTDGDVRTVVLERILGEVPKATPENRRALGLALGRLNSIRDYPHPALISVDAIRPHFPELAAGLPEAMRDGYLALTKALPDIDALPQSLIHFEASLKNSVRKPDGTIVLVDWDEAGLGATVLDPGYHLISLFVTEELEFDEAGAKEFYRGYLSAHTLSAAERSCLFDASLFHALRYVIYGDTEKRWRRLTWAVKNRKRLESAIPRE